MGAGVIPFSVSEGKVYFLFQTTFTGRKVGYYIDFGGGLDAGENYREAAIREFVEETETMYFSDNVQQAIRTTERIEHQIPIVEGLFDETLSKHPDWWCKRAHGNHPTPKLWRTFFIEFPHRDIEELNREWAADNVGRFKKRRELVWVAGRELLTIYGNAPEKLWKRVRQLKNATEKVQSILLSKESRPSPSPAQGKTAPEGTAVDTAVTGYAFLRLVIPARPNRPEPNSQLSLHVITPP